jgi:hypothetical protein
MSATALILRGFGEKIRENDLSIFRAAPASPK